MRKYIFLGFFITIVGLAKEQPATDDYVNAILIMPSSSCVNTSGSNIGVVSTNNDPCAEIEKRNLGYKFTATNANPLCK